MRKNRPVEVTVYIAASLEGYITDPQGATDWVCDDELFEQTCRKFGVICMGNTTFKELEGDLNLMDDVQNIVLAHKPPKKSKYSNVHYATSAEDAIACAQKLGFKKLLVIGGAKTNQTFMQAGLVSKVFVDIHPILLESGLSLFGDFNKKFEFKMVKNKWHNDGFMHAEYVLRP